MSTVAADLKRYIELSSKYYLTAKNMATNGKITIIIIPQVERKKRGYKKEN